MMKAHLYSRAYILATQYDNTAILNDLAYMDEDELLGVINRLSRKEVSYYGG